MEEGSFKSRYVSTCHALRIDPIVALLGVLDAGTQSGVLDLTSHHLSPKAAIALAEALRPDASFTTAIFGDCMLGDEGCCVIVEALKGNRTVTTLDLRGNNIRSDGATALAALLRKNVTITKLSLEWNSVGLWDAGIKGLAESLIANSTLKELDLRNNRISPHGGVALALALKSNRTLLKVDLRWNNIGIVGGKAFAETMKFNFTVVFLDVTGNEVAEETVQAIDVAVMRNRDVNSLKDSYHNRSQKLEEELARLRKEHDQHMKLLADQLRSRENEHQQSGTTLRSAIGELSARLALTKENEASLEVQLHQERNARQLLTVRLSEVEAALNEARRDATHMAQRLMTDVAHEKELRVAVEDARHSEVDKLTIRVREAERERDSFKRELEDAKSLLHDERGRVKDYTDKTSQLHQENISFRDKLERMVLEHETRFREEREKIMQEAASKELALEKELASLRAQLANARSSSNNELSELQQRLREEEESTRQIYEERFRKLTKTTDEMNKTNTELVSEVAALRKELVELQIQLDKERDKSRTTEHEVLKCRSELEGARSERTQLRHALEAAQRAETGLRAEYERRLSGHDSEVQAIADQYKRNLVSLETKLAQKEEEISGLQAKLLQLRLEQQQKISNLELQLNSSLHRTFADAKVVKSS